MLSLGQGIKGHALVQIDAVLHDEMLMDWVEHLGVPGGTTSTAKLSAPTTQGCLEASYSAAGRPKPGARS